MKPTQIKVLEYMPFFVLNVTYEVSHLDVTVIDKEMILPNQQLN